MTSRRPIWALGIIGAAISVISAVALWASGADMRRWPFPGVVLVEWLILGLTGLAGVVLDEGGRYSRWGLLSWVSVGGLFGSTILGFLEFGLFAFPAVLALGGAVLLVDKRNRRHVLAHIGLAAAIAAVNFLALLLIANV